MMKVNKLNLFNFLLLSVLVPSVSGGNANNIKEQSKIAMKPQRNNSAEPSKTVITVTPPNYTTFRKITKNNIKHLEKLTTIKSNYTKQDVTRQIRNIPGNYGDMECLECHTKTISKNDKCYHGDVQTSVNCVSGEECYTELHPQYIKRGCMSRSRLNRTFICKCPLCNDKPFDDTASYEYKTIRDWKYDNRRLQTAVIGMDLLCKVCETKGINRVADKYCKQGKDADYMVCGKNQLCYTNIDLGSDLISRGCTDLPGFNSIYNFCNKSKCNNEIFRNPHINKRMSEVINLKKEEYIHKALVSSSSVFQYFGSESKFMAFTANFVVVFF